MKPPGHSDATFRILRMRLAGAAILGLAALLWWGMRAAGAW